VCTPAGRTRSFLLLEKKQETQKSPGKKGTFFCTQDPLPEFQAGGGEEELKKGDGGEESKGKTRIKVAIQGRNQLPAALAYFDADPLNFLRSTLCETLKQKDFAVMAVKKKETEKAWENYFHLQTDHVEMVGKFT